MTHASPRDAHLRVPVQQVLDRRLVHLQRVHKVLRVPPYTQLVALPKLAGARLKIACRIDQLNCGKRVSRCARTN